MVLQSRISGVQWYNTYVHMSASLPRFCPGTTVVGRKTCSLQKSKKRCFPYKDYSLIQKKCQGGNKCALPVTVKFHQFTRRFGRVGFARLFKLTKHFALLFYPLLPHLLSCMRGTRNLRKILLFRFKEGSCQLLAKACALSTG